LLTIEEAETVMKDKLIIAPLVMRGQCGHRDSQLVKTDVPFSRQALKPSRTLVFLPETPPCHISGLASEHGLEIEGLYQAEYSRLPTVRAGWYLIDRQPLRGSRNASFEEQMHLLPEGRVLPNAALAILVAIAGHVAEKRVLPVDVWLRTCTSLNRDRCLAVHCYNGTVKVSAPRNFTRHDQLGMITMIAPER